MRIQGNRFPLYVGAVLLALVGVVMLWGAWALNQTTRAFLDHGVKTQGTILAYRDSSNKKKNPEESTVGSYPTIRFADQRGLTHEFESTEADDPLVSPVGDPLGVIYLPEDPTQVRLDTWGALGGGELILVLVGLAFLGMAALIGFVFASGRKFPLEVAFPVGLALFAGLLGWITWAVGTDSLYLSSHGIRTTAVVVEAQGAALVEYTVQGKTYQKQTSIRDEDHPLARGQLLPLVYDPQKPGRSRVDTWDQLWLPTALTGGFTLLTFFLALGSGVYFFRHRGLTPLSR